MTNLKIRGERLWDSLMETARIGGTPDGGIRRLTLSEEDARVRAWFKEAVEAAGMTLSHDLFGNMFAIRPGKNNDLPPIAMGSHLDTQPTGGKFDGVLGVLAGLEVIRTLNDAGLETEAPLMVVNWTNEEGSRFSPAMLGSGGFAGVYSADQVNGRRDSEGISFGDALEAIGWRGDLPPKGQPIGAMFELHIEQGPILEAEGKDIGIVTGVQGLRWYEAIFEGRAAHTGSTPMSMRQNALLPAADLIRAVDAIGLAHAPDAVATVGHVTVSPNSNNVIPGEVRLTIDMRHPRDAVLAAMDAELQSAFARILAASGVSGALTPVSDVAAVAFDPDCIDAVRQATARMGLSAREIVSGAGHDAVHIARLAPTTMIFVPSAGGLSHNPAESTTFDECAAGAQVLLEAVLGYDRSRAEALREKETD